jgi:curved DNA-binding protein CbpA
MKDDHYKVLEVSRGASADEIQHAYRTLALRYHPDRNSAPDAAARMTAINEAWEVLGDPHRRREYDALLERPPVHPEFAASILLAARDVVLRSAWRVVEDTGKMLVLENARQRVRVVFVDRVDAAAVQSIARRSPEFCVVLAVNVEEPIRAGARAAVIDLLRAQRHGAPLPEAPEGSGRSLFAAFLA